MKRKKILFVCTGNTCRSPMAEMILRSKIKERKIKWWDVMSCGVHAQLSDGMNENSRRALDEKNIKINEKFSPRQLSQKLIDNSILVITMTQSHKQMLEGCGNVVCISSFCGKEVPDPYGGGMEIYRITRDIIMTACDKIIDDYILKYEE